MGTVSHILNRPRPPSTLVSSAQAGDSLGVFVPAQDLLEWIRRAYLDKSGALFAAEHQHLNEATIGCLWTNVANSRHQRRIVGQAEIPATSIGRAGKWQRGRALQQIEEWFGNIPDFLLTFDAFYASYIDNASFCALVDHELCHCAQDQDDFGQPKFSKKTSKPIFVIRGHDVEEFVSVVRRFGVNAAGTGAKSLVKAAAQKPEIARARMARVCGTCVQRSAA